jgi:hypothetical protein
MDLHGYFLQSHEGAGPLYMKPVVNFDKLCEVYSTDLAKIWLKETVLKVPENKKCQKMNF